MVLMYPHISSQLTIRTDGRGLFSSWVNTPLYSRHCMGYAGTEGLGFTGSHVDNVYTGHFSLMSTLDLLSHTLQIPGIWDERSNSLTSLIL